MRKFPDTFETQMISFISAFSICMTLRLIKDENLCHQNKHQKTIFHQISID